MSFHWIPILDSKWTLFHVVEVEDKNAYIVFSVEKVQTNRPRNVDRMSLTDRLFNLLEVWLPQLPTNAPTELIFSTWPTGKCALERTITGTFLYFMRITELYERGISWRECPKFWIMEWSLLITQSQKITYVILCN